MVTHTVWAEGSPPSVLEWEHVAAEQLGEKVRKCEKHSSATGAYSYGSVASFS